MESPEQLKLDTIGDDCFMEILNRLPTNYLYTVAETSKHFSDLAAIQYRRNYPDKVRNII